jgi:hypothetical protein
MTAARFRKFCHCSDGITVILEMRGGAVGAKRFERLSKKLVSFVKK